ncbi:hypothetical protein HYPSUDRAFT_55110 [Hypholoma sublateritium FD-334 SS-4]|uniref:Uncharacterized protein n=1 Tax=Hypholoma sublateritium (strain FD-334 SS-4) TaxID=945553 RepID=A0A0D2NSW9_HYPSF|nr:hypothetical protein HYPSUDRAFT_55110 [Hypholoma sublateritium FD-334 SS-4]
MLPLAFEWLRGDNHYVEGAEISTSHSRAHEEMADTLELVDRDEVIGRRFQSQAFIIELRRNWKNCQSGRGDVGARRGRSLEISVLTRERSHLMSFAFVRDVYVMLEVVSAILKEKRGSAEPAKSETTTAKYAYLFGEELSGAVQGGGMDGGSFWCGWEWSGAADKLTFHVAAKRVNFMPARCAYLFRLQSRGCGTACCPAEHTSELGVRSTASKFGTRSQFYIRILSSGRANACGPNLKGLWRSGGAWNLVAEEYTAIFSTHGWCSICTIRELRGRQRIEGSRDGSQVSQFVIRVQRGLEERRVDGVGGRVSRELRNLRSGFWVQRDLGRQRREIRKWRQAPAHCKPVQHATAAAQSQRWGRVPYGPIDTSAHIAWPSNAPMLSVTGFLAAPIPRWRSCRMAQHCLPRGIDGLAEVLVDTAVGLISPAKACSAARNNMAACASFHAPSGGAFCLDATGELTVSVMEFVNVFLGSRWAGRSGVGKKIV